MIMSEPRAIFSLNQAREMLPQVKHLTADAVRQAESLAVQLHGLADDDPEHVSLSAALKAVSMDGRARSGRSGWKPRASGWSTSITVKAITAGAIRRKPWRTTTATTTASRA